jgi:hypothetical protein
MQVKIMMVEAEQFLNKVRDDETMPFPERNVHTSNAMDRIADGSVIIQSVLEELLKELQDGE